MSSKTPNLFDYATKELSQDAMICWLIAWSGQCKSEAWENEELRRCGIRLVKAMLKKHGRDIEFNDGYTVKILRQKKRIDILARINGRQVLLIEDKTFTKNHNKQLENYYNHVVSGKTDLGKVEQEDLYPIYCKTGNQSLADDCRIEGIKNYKVFNRKDFLDVLDSYEGCNSTLRDFRKHLKELEIQTNSYVQWRPSSRRDSWRAWEGFYRYLECGWAETSRRIGWEYVPIGDFLGFNWEPIGTAGDLYLQIEMRSGQDVRLCFKVWAKGKSKEQQQVLKFGWHDRVMKAGKGLVVRPRILKIGNTMTVAWWKKEWMAFGHDDDDKLDVSRTVENLKRAEEVLNEAIREGQVE